VATQSRRAWPAIVLSSLAFGAVHAQPQDVAPLVTMGVVLGFLRLRCNSLWPCIVLHMLFNARTMITAVLAPELLTEG
jgi:membrane protease YdiL (CAAX protease family)